MDSGEGRGGRHEGKDESPSSAVGGKDHSLWRTEGGGGEGREGLGDHLGSQGPVGVGPGGPAERGGLEVDHEEVDVGEGGGSKAAGLGSNLLDEVVPIYSWGR
jgi:hypothetical protein